MQLATVAEVTDDVPFWAANFRAVSVDLRQFDQLTKNQEVHTQVNADSRVKFSTLMKTRATVLGIWCKTSYTNLAVPKGVFASIQIQAEYLSAFSNSTKLDQFQSSMKLALTSKRCEIFLKMNFGK
jgi:hypothetical protein